VSCGGSVPLPRGREFPGRGGGGVFGRVLSYVFSLSFSPSMSADFDVRARDLTLLCIDFLLLCCFNDFFTWKKYLFT